MTRSYRDQATVRQRSDDFNLKSVMANGNTATDAIVMIEEIVEVV